MSKRVSLLLILLITCTALLLVGNAGAQESSRSKPVADPAALSEAALELNSQRQPQVPAAIPGWTRIAYQKLENDNWDIFIYDSSGSKRLTSDAADDLYPAINRGGTKVAFSSDRGNSNGRLDLYSMNLDKSGLQKLFNNWSAFPAFSPNGSRIAFQGWAGNDYELYVINQDGSNLRRLTSSPDFDGQPAWSPDGETIAFSSRRGGQYSIYTIQPDGSNLQKVSSYPLSLHPKWSPDGTKIAFDADVDNDGWQEVALINADGKNQKMIFDPGSSATAWAGSWSPDNQSLGITDISLILQNNQWLWVTGELKQWDTNSKAVSSLIAGDTNWYFDWVSLDQTPPQVSITPLQSYSPADAFYLSWTGTDFGGSGLKDYSIHYRAPSTNGWRTYWNNTVATAAQFMGVPGETFEFLLRARDNALNRGIWSEQPVVSTTFYQTKVEGRLFDNRRTPLSDIPIIIDPAPLFPAQTGPDGGFLAYTTSPGVSTLTINQPNYTPLPITDISPNANFTQNITLLPSDNLVNNGTFEGSASDPSGWTSGGSLPVFITAQDRASGLYSLQIGAGTLNSTQEKDAIAVGTVAQDLTIPATLQAPTLAFMAKAAGDAAGDATTLEVIVQAGGEAAVTLFQGQLKEAWDLYWFPMDAFQNKNVELLFRVVQDSADPLLKVNLDDISIGSAHPDLWIQAQPSPQSAIAGDNLTLDLTYGNRGGVDAVDTAIFVYLDQKILYQSATPPSLLNGAKLRWNIPVIPARSAPQTITIELLATAAQANPYSLVASFVTNTDEANLENNIDQQFVRPRREIFMPISP